MKDPKKIIEKLKALRGRLPVPKYESGYLLTDEEWDQIFTVLEENEKLKESCASCFCTSLFDEEGYCNSCGALNE